LRRHATVASPCLTSCWVWAWICAGLKMNKLARASELQCFSAAWNCGV